MGELSVREYIQIATSDVDDVINEWGFTEFSDAKLSTLSMGLRQQVSAASVLASNPSVLIADEPAGSLSTPEALEMYRRMVSYCRNHSISLLLVTHDSHSEGFADRIVRISDGRIGEEWTPGSDEESVIDQHGWLRLPRQLKAQVPSTAQIMRTNNDVVLSGMTFEPDVSKDFSSSRENSNKLSNYVIQTLGGQREISIGRGSLSAITGGTGSGKTTALRALWSSIQAQADDSEPALRAVLFEQDVAQELSAYELGANEKIIAKLGIQDLAHRRLKTLSGGQRQKSLLAVALSTECDLLMIDDPLRALDEESRELVIDILGDITDRALIVATSDANLIARAANITNLDD